MSSRVARTNLMIGVVEGRDSRSEGRGFESQHRILDGHFFTYICCKIVMMFV